MKYICLGYIEPGTFEGMSEDERHAVFDECFEHNDHLRANGHLVAEVPLQPPETAVTLYWKNGKVATTDGPMRKRRNRSAAFRSLRRETSIMPFSLSHSNQALSMDLDRLRYAGRGFERNHKGERAATAKGDHAMRAATRERVITVMALVLVIGIGFLPPKAAAQSDRYSKRAPVDQYLMERNAEILLARSAAPDSISSDATILVLGRQGYETAVRGKNGFVCMVERSWIAAFDSPEFWNPKVRGAECLK